MKITETTVKTLALIIAASVLMLESHRASSGEPLNDSSVGIAPNAFAPVAKGTGFAMDGYFVWCGSIIKVGDMYEMFASRWPASTKFPEGYRQHSEIVRAEAPKPEGPYVFKEIIISKRDAGKWDSAMAHNPSIYQVGGTFVLYYIGSDVGSTHRQIGIATAPSVAGPWTRRDKPLELGLDVDANNPAAWFESDGSVKLVWRTADLRVCESVAKSFEGPYTLVDKNLWPSAKVEDFFMFKQRGTYHLICEDNAGQLTGHDRKWGGHLVSDNGITNWRAAEQPVAYDDTIHWTDGTDFKPVRRERPWLLIDGGNITYYLFTAVFDGKKTWNQPIPLSTPIEVDQTQ
jgi:hypothetical protein